MKTILYCNHQRKAERIWDNRKPNQTKQYLKPEWLDKETLNETFNQNIPGKCSRCKDSYLMKKICRQEKLLVVHSKKTYPLWKIGKKKSIAERNSYEILFEVSLELFGTHRNYVEECAPVIWDQNWVFWP